MGQLVILFNRKTNMKATFFIFSLMVILAVSSAQMNKAMIKQIQAMKECKKAECNGVCPDEKPAGVANCRAICGGVKAGNAACRDCLVKNGLPGACFDCMKKCTMKSFGQ